MLVSRTLRYALVAIAGMCATGNAWAQSQQAAPIAPNPPATVCGLSVPTPAKLPPAASGPLVYLVVPCFQKQGGASVIDPATYLYYIQLHGSQPSQDHWIPYNDETERTIEADFKRLWATNFLDDLSIEVVDYPFANGVMGKIVVYDMEERQRVKIVDYVGSKKVDQSKIDDELKKQGLQIHLDSFIDQGLLNRVSGVVRDMYAEKGYQYAQVKPEVVPVAGGTKTVNVTFHIAEGPQVKIAKVNFEGNRAISDSKLASKMKDNKGPIRWLPIISGPGTYKEAKFDDDAQKVLEYYRQRGYVKAEVGQPQLRILEDSNDGRTRYVELEVPVTEGPRYKIGTVTFSGNTVVKTEGLRPFFKMQTGEWFDEKAIRNGFKKAQEAYGSAGYMEFTGVPEYSFPGQAKPAAGASDGAAGPPVPGLAKTPVPVPEITQPPKKRGGLMGAIPFVEHEEPSTAPVVNVTMRIDEGKRYFVNRISFVGNTTTRDNVIRREIRLYENGVFNTEALKYSVRRINQLGYFKNLEGDAIDVQKTAGSDNKVDIKLKVEEQNRNQITFGAGVSQYEGFFGQLAFQTSNFMGRGETFSVSAQQGNLAKNYQVGFTEPFLFDRPITAGVQLFDQSIQYIGQFTQDSIGATMTWGFPVGPFSRLFANYSYQDVTVKDLNPAVSSAAALSNNVLLQETLLLSEGGRRKVSKAGPSFVYNTVDNPIFPSTGKRFTLGVDFAGIGGDTKYVSTNTEGVWYLQENKRMSLGLRGAFQYIRPYGGSDLPIFEKVVLGGEYSVRGYDLRSIGPRDLTSDLVLGGNKSLLFNVEQSIGIAGPVHLILFYDAGQVKDVGQSFSWKEPLLQLTRIGGLGPGDAASTAYVVGGFNSTLPTRIDNLGETSAFKTSTGAEIRFFMPVLNVPFRLIFAMNPQRGGVLDNNFQPEKLFKFRFAVGTTF